jgi:hypothetical protein
MTRAASWTTCWCTTCSTAMTQHYVLVVNAGNIQKDWDWINA